MVAAALRKAKQNQPRLLKVFIQRNSIFILYLVKLILIIGLVWSGNKTPVLVI